MNKSNESAESLARKCLEVAKLADRAIAWVCDDENQDKVGAEMASLRREFRRSGIRARKLANAARRNMCVGVYGPSQAGKSYLISVLGRPKGGELMAAFDGADAPLRYLDRINPEGQGESTGLVTRFTAAKVPAEPGFPIKVRLLSEADLARVLANAFAMDGDGSELPPDAGEMEALLADAEAKAGDATDPAFAVQDMWDVQEYISEEFGRLAYFAPFRAYWERAAAVAPKLDPAGRADLMSVLWGCHRPLTDLFLSLATCLKALGDAQEAFVPMDALIPREQSIIDVQTLKGLDGEADFPAVAVRAASGASATVPRGELTALVSEIVVPMADRPWDFMNGTDLLDFPGTRNRFTHDLADYLEKGEAPLAQLFLRGKVAYLFDRYVAEQELTSMLLCVGEGNMEAKDLPGLLDRWIAATHGATPEERQKAQCILFFVLTKFDTLLLESGGSGDDPRTRFDRRIQNSMIEPFGKLPDSWLNRWAGNAPFGNTFWLRNPKYEATVIEYDADGREVRLRPDREDRVAELREGAVGSELVRRHFDNPELAWEAAMEIDDGGVTRLAGALAAVCVPEMKFAQVESQLDGQVRYILRRLGSFHESSDIEARLAEKREAADCLLDALDECFDQHRWGELMEALTVDPSEIADEIARVPTGIQIVSEAEGARAAGSAPDGNAASRPRPGRPRPGSGRPAAAESPALPERISMDPALQIRRMTMEAFQAERALTVWKDMLGDFVRHPERFGLYRLTAATADDLVEELIVASRRLGLEARIQSVLERWNFSLLAERRALPASTVAAAEINSFVACLGMNELDEADRPEVDFDDGTTRRIFAEPPVQYAFLSLPERPESRLDDRFVDWTYALYRVFEDNARNIDGKTVDTRQNRRLGEILEGLKANGQASAGGAP